MRALVQQKEEAFRLRKLGKSYNEILRVIPVAKSSLSLWLQKMPLTEDEKAVLKRRKDENISIGRIRAAASLRNLRLARDSALLQTAEREFKLYQTDPFFYVGMALYWAEGSKRSSTFMFVNSDSDMMLVMLKWIEKFLGVPRSAIRARLYTHKPFAYGNYEQIWSKVLSIPIENFRRTIYKPTGLLVRKRPNYVGCLRIEIGGVTYFRKYLFWQKMMLEDYKKQG